MRLLADENLPQAAVRALRAAGHDVFWAAESQAGAADDVLLGRAVREARLLLTFDRDFGALTATGPTSAPGVVLLRFTPTAPDALAEFLVTLLARADVAWWDHLSVVTLDHIRQRTLRRAV